MSFPPRFSLKTLTAALLCGALALPANAFETIANSAWVFDMTTHTVLLEKDADISLPPASMSKLMTAELLFKALKEGRVTPETTFGVSEHAVSFTTRGGSTMYLQTSDRPNVAELIQGMLVNSGNDACVVIAEGLEGTEEAFARKMTERGVELGLKHSTFANSSGWPDPMQRMSMEDLGLLAVHLIEEYPDQYPVFSQLQYDYKSRAPANANNRNPLLKLNVGADGLKTGHTQEAGYGLVGSAMQGDRRIVFVISGLDSDANRAKEAGNIATWAFNNFKLRTPVKAGEKIAEAPVWLGAQDKVELVAGEDLRLLVPSVATEIVKGEAVFDAPIAAPIAEGQRIGELVLQIDGVGEKRVPLVARTAIEEGGFGVKAKAAFGRITAKAVAAVNG
jgi:D-alanyl-D-alanine carboxypeptidase (penicillin-binding protein 5/6)